MFQLNELDPNLEFKHNTRAELPIDLFVWLFIAAQAIFSHLAAFTITGDRTANLDLCLPLTAFSSKSYFTCHTYCDLRFKVISERPVILTSKCRFLAKEQSLPILTSLTS
jgi:hypothetical protein